MKKRTKTWLLVVLVLLVLGGGYAYREFNRKATSLQDETPVAITSVSKILDEFSKDAQAANRQYLGKVIQLNGTIENVEADKKGFVTIVLSDPSSSSSVRCSMDSTQSNGRSKLFASSPVTIKGICTGYTPDELGLGADLVLNRCIVVTK
jgi:hypothetical protein